MTVPLTSLLNELLSFRRCVANGGEAGTEEEGGNGPWQRRTYADAFKAMARLVAKKKKKANNSTRRRRTGGRKDDGHSNST